MDESLSIISHERIFRTIIEIINGILLCVLIIFPNFGTINLFIVILLLLCNCE